MPGDILVGKVTPKGESPMTPEEKAGRMDHHVWIRPRRKFPEVTGDQCDHKSLIARNPLPFQLCAEFFRVTDREMNAAPSGMPSKMKQKVAPNESGGACQKELHGSSKVIGSLKN